MTSMLVGNPIPLVNSANGFPHAVHAGVMRVVAAAIHYAWSEIRSNPAKHLVPASKGAPAEDRYTEAICQCLHQMLLSEAAMVPGFNSATFDSISRSESLCNFSGFSLNKQPDILIRLADGPLIEARRWVGIYIEAKIVNMANPIGKYTKEGIDRFIKGEYGWAMQDGMMLAYQVPKHRPINSLAKALRTDAELATVADATGVWLDETTNQIVGASCSVHNRKWEYVGGGNPGNIRIWHLWGLDTPS